MIVSVWASTCYYIFFCIIKTPQNVKFIHVYKSPVISAGVSGRPLCFLVTPLPPPNFSQDKYGFMGLIIFTVKPCYTDIEGTVEIVHFD